ncbi:MAG: alpha/beta hydrolase [Ferruginibacter sp.]|nr:alpha/beta hydrolase [Ferruginibacter sp.]
MKVKNLFPLAAFIVIVFASCSKSDSGGGTTPAPTPVVARTIMDTGYGADLKQKMDIYLPANRSTTSTKVLILIHGGGWTGGDKSDFAAVIDTLKQRLPGYAIFNLNYRLASFPTNNLFPTQEMDIKTAVESIYNNRSAYLVSDKFVLMGTSAGGHLSLLQAYKHRSVVKIKALVDFFGPTDMAALYNDYSTNIPTQFAIASLMSGTPATNPALYQSSSPIQFVDALNCPTIVIQGGADPVVNATTQSQALVTKLSSFSVPNQYVFYPAGGHGDWDAATYTDAFNKIQVFLGVHVP